MNLWWWSDVILMLIYFTFWFFIFYFATFCILDFACFYYTSADCLDSVYLRLWLYKWICFSPWCLASLSFFCIHNSPKPLSQFRSQSMMLGFIFDIFLLNISQHFETKYRHHSVNNFSENIHSIKHHATPLLKFIEKK